MGPGRTTSGRAWDLKLDKINKWAVLEFSSRKLEVRPEYVLLVWIYPKKKCKQYEKVIEKFGLARMVWLD